MALLRSHAIVLVLVAVSQWQPGCGHGDHKVQKSDLGQLIALTYNTALSFSDMTKPSRLNETADLFRNKTVADMWDVVCLQEVQEREDQVRIMDAAREGGFMYSLSFLNGTNASVAGPLRSGPACNGLKLLRLGQCMTANCTAQIQSGNQRLVLSCAFTRCSSELIAAQLSQECINCINREGFNGLTSGVGSRSCLSPMTRFDFQPTYGLLMLSKYPLSNTLAQTFRDEPSFFSRGYLRATVAGGRTLGEWTAVCSHLYPNTIGIPYVGSRGNASNENFENTVAILNDTVVKKSDRVLLMGDMNHSPNEEEFLNSYNTVLNESYCSPYASLVGNCTFCASNPVAQQAGATRSFIYDHIYVRASSFLQCSPNGSATGADVSARRWSPGPRLSDHYGVVVEIDNIPPPSPSSADKIQASFLALAIGLLLLAVI